MKCKSKINSNRKPSRIAHAWHSSIQEVEKDNKKFKISISYIEFEASLGYMTPNEKKNRKGSRLLKCSLVENIIVSVQI